MIFLLQKNATVYKSVLYLPGAMALLFLLPKHVVLSRNRLILYETFFYIEEMQLTRQMKY